MNNIRRKATFPLVRTSTLEKKLVFSLLTPVVRGFMQIFNDLSVHNQHILDEAIASGRPVITIMNHDSTMDDPLLFGVLSSDFFKRHGKIRHTLCAQEICFASKIQSRFFSAAQGIPVVRGAGIHQAGLDHAISVLNENGWVNLFPEAKVNEDPEKLLPFRWGVTRLIREAEKPPILIPIMHSGMADILPYIPGKWNRLHLHKNLDVVFGNPLDFQSAKLEKRFRQYTDTGVLDDAHVRKEMIDLIQSEFHYLQTYHRMVISRSRTRHQSRYELDASAIIPIPQY